MENKTIERLKQDFENKFDCYADTDNGLPIMAMTFDAVKELFSKYASQQTASLEARIKELEGALKDFRDADFAAYIKNARNKFAGKIRQCFDLMSMDDRVAIEDLLIAYDQMYDKLTKKI